MTGMSKIRTSGQVGALCRDDCGVELFVCCEGALPTNALCL